MRFTLLLITTFLSWPIYDSNLFRQRGDSEFLAVSVEVSETESEKLQRKKQIKRHRLDVVPKKHRAKKKIPRSRCNYFSTKPRDLRFSDQKKIRRMFNNL